MRLAHEVGEILAAAVVGMHIAVVGDIVAVVFQRRRIKRQQPYRIHPQALDVVELFRQALEVADAVAVAVAKRLHMDLVDDRVLVPQRIVGPVARRRAIGLQCCACECVAHCHPCLK